MRTEKGITIVVLEEKEIKTLELASKVFTELHEVMSKESATELCDEYSDCSIATLDSVATCIDTCNELIESYRMRAL